MERLMSFQLKLEMEERENSYKRAFNYSLNLLSRMPRTEKQLKDKLLKYEYGYTVIDEIISKLKELGYINDEEYTVEYVNSRIERDGPYKIKNQLYSKGIAKNIIEKVFEDWDYRDERKVAYSLALKKSETMERSFKSRNKVARFLQNRGFSYEIIKDVINEIYSIYEY